MALQTQETEIASVAQAVLICGWPGEAFMGDLLRELDHGPAALPGAHHAQN